LSELAPDGLRIEMEDRTDDGKGKAVIGIGQHPVPCFVPRASAGGMAPRPYAGAQTLQGVIQDGETETRQPAFCRWVDNLHGQDGIRGKYAGQIHGIKVFRFHSYITSSASYRHVPSVQ